MDRMKEFKDQSVEELKALFRDLSKDIFELKNEISTTRKIDKPHLLPKKKRDRARVLTLLSQKGEKV
ncbi:MAG: 50S ribosomal protein L29 [Chlamydiae bacterium]|nr:50S ribosomal protein L29 [Chlamydiota bacterium]